MNKKQKSMLLRILITVAMLIALALLRPEGAVRLGAYLAAYLFIGHDVLKKAWKGILNGQVFSETFLMGIATIGAFVLAILTKSGDYFEAIAVLLFYQVGELFESWAVGKSRKNIASLMDIRPDTANLETEEGQMEEVDPDEVEVGSVIVVQPGEKVAIDGEILTGFSSLNTAALTGESLPMDVQPGDRVQSGAINMTGVLRIRTTVPAGESTAARILDLVENATSRKSRSEHFIARFARVYTPLVCYLALAVAVLPPVFSLIFTGSADFLTWLYRALTFLVISCPCALVISVPLTFFSAIGGASREGILVKGSNYLEALAHTDTVVLDKTGTLTKGTFEVTNVMPVGMDADALLHLAAHGECASSHPISRSLQKAYGKDIDRNLVQNIREESGFGVCARVEGREVAIGNEKLMQKLGLSAPAVTEAATVAHVAVDGRYAGCILVADTVKPTAREAIRAMKEAGVARVVMLTGDRQETALQIASQLGIDQVESQLLPADKVEKMENLLKTRKSGAQVLFAGDGINDAPVLTRADIGVAMGGVGSDAAIEAADVVLMKDDPLHIAKAIRLGKRCMAIVWQNILFSLIIKVLFLLLSGMGMVNMGLAIFADVGVMVLAVLNATRALRKGKE